MNLLMLSGDSSVARGYEGAFYQMLRRFSGYWERIDILCPGGAGASERVLFDNVHVHPSPWPKALHPLYIRRKGAALLAERPYALMTSQDSGFFYNGIGAAWLSHAAGIPYVSEMHHIEGYPRAVTRKEQLYRVAADHYIPFAAKRAAAFRAVNAVEVPELLRKLGVPDTKIMILPAMYIDFSIFQPIPYTPRAYDGVFVGRFAANKGLFTLLDALAIVKTRRPTLRFGMLGRGELLPALRQRIAELGLDENITLMTDYVSHEEIAQWYNSAGLLVCASTAEGGPRVTVEAMACGVPVISTPVGLMRELIDDGENGLIFRGDADDLAAKMCMLLDDPALRVRMGERGRMSVQHFQADRVIENYAMGYQRLVEHLEPA
jgi:glycosyltransferase involved in cell wall biosynthesis